MRDPSASGASDGGERGRSSVVPSWTSALAFAAVGGAVSLAAAPFWKFLIARIVRRRDDGERRPGAARRSSGDGRASPPVPYSAQMGFPTQSSTSTVSTVLRLCCINDVYQFRGVNGVGGFASLGTLLDQHRLGGNAIFTVNGDFLGGSLLASESHGKIVIDVLNLLRPDAVAVGNHECDFGDAVLRERIEQSRFPWLGANVFDGVGLTEEQAAAARADDGPGDEPPLPLFSGVTDVTVIAFAVNTRTGVATKLGPAEAESRGKTDDEVVVRIGLFGVCTQATPQLAYPDDIVFGDVVTAARRAVSVLRKQRRADIVIGVTHVRLGADRIIAKALGDSCDLIVGGHDHDPSLTQVGESLIFKCGQNANFLGVCDLRVDFDLSSEKAPAAASKSGGTRHVVNLRCSPSIHLIANSGYEPDARIEQLVADYRDELRRRDAENSAYLDEPALRIAPDGDPLFSLTSVVRCKESTFANLIADAFRWYFAESAHGRPAGTDAGRAAGPGDGAWARPDIPIIGCINGGFIRGDTQHAPGGVLSVRALREELPFPKAVCVIRLTGADLVAGVEQQLTLCPAPTGAFPHYSADVRLRIRQRPAGPGQARVVSMSVCGEEVQPTRHYDVAMSVFMANGGDGLDAFARGVRVASSEAADAPRNAMAPQSGEQKQKSVFALDIVVAFLRFLARSTGDPNATVATVRPVLEERIAYTD